MSCTGLVFRRPVPDDWARVMAVLPEWRDGRDLCRRFCARARAGGRAVVRAATSPVNDRAIAFHTAPGFSVRADEVIDGAPAPSEYSSHDGPLVQLELALDREVTLWAP